MQCFLGELLVGLSPGVEGRKGVPPAPQQLLSAQPWTAISPACPAWPGALTACYFQEQALTPQRRALVAAAACSAAPLAVLGNSAAETSPDVEHFLSCSKNHSLCPKSLVLCLRRPSQGSGPRLIFPLYPLPWSIKSQFCPLSCLCPWIPKNKDKSWPDLGSGHYPEATILISSFWQRS